VWVITGTDEAGVDRAAHALDEATLANRFAVALARAACSRCRGSAGRAFREL